MPTLKRGFLIAVATALSSFAAGQHSCSTLSVTGSGQPGTNLTFALTRADPHAPAFLLVADHPEHTVLHFGALGSLPLGLSNPFLVVSMGTTDAHGQAALVASIPLHIAQMAFHAQGTTVRVVHEHPPLRFCPSNVVAFQVGSHH